MDTQPLITIPKLATDEEIRQLRADIAAALRAAYAAGLDDAAQAAEVYMAKIYAAAIRALAR